MITWPPKPACGSNRPAASSNLRRRDFDFDQGQLAGWPYCVNMVWLCDELRLLATALILSLALALGVGAAAVAALPGTSVEQLHHLAIVHPASIAHDADGQEPCDDRFADCCSSLAHCSGIALVAPADAPGFAGSAHRTWTLAGAQCLHGIDPLVNRHPPRDLG